MTSWSKYWRAGSSSDSVESMPIDSSHFALSAARAARAASRPPPPRQKTSTKVLQRPSVSVCGVWKNSGPVTSRQRILTNFAVLSWLAVISSRVTYMFLSSPSASCASSGSTATAATSLMAPLCSSLIGAIGGISGERVMSVMYIAPSVLPAMMGPALSRDEHFGWGEVVQQSAVTPCRRTFAHSTFLGMIASFTWYRRVASS
mmetsp:Transcript_69779/g.145865  ORF Transcript_69779/g.145865 Transcript_69779/m.145865 type:complete len:203 (-) Transcript_69779:490-1098(-)